MENNISILNFAAQKVPDFKEQRGKDWIQFGTEGQWKNRYPEYLLDLYRRSAKNHAIINSKKDYVVGQGWAVKDENLSTFRLAELEQFVKHPNQYESLNDILEKVAMDYELYNGFALEIVYNQLNDKIAAIYHADFARYRSNEDGSCYYYSEDWSKHNPKVEKIDAFNWKEPEGKQLLYVKGYSPDCKYYPLPTYLGSTAYIELDVEVANFHLNSIHNGFMGGTLINFYNGEPTAEEQEEIERQIKDKFTNTDNANSIVLNFSDSRDRGAEIQQLNGNDFDKRFDILNRTVQKEIYAGHQVVDPALFGIKEEGLFTSRTQLIDSFELFQNTYINNRQQFIERVFNELAALQGLDGCLYIKDTEPISVQFSEATVVSVMTNSEIREKIGLEPLDEEETKEVEAQFNRELHLETLINAGSDNYEVQSEGRSFDFASCNSLEEARTREAQLLKYWFSSLGPVESAVLEMLKDDPATPYLTIGRALNISNERLMQALQELSRAEAIVIKIDEVIDSSQRVTEVTKKGEKILDDIEPMKERFEIRYVYGLRSNAGTELVIPTTRKFCKDLCDVTAGESGGKKVNLGSTGTKTWDLEQIVNMGVKADRNVWQRGGGYWGKSYHCRHEWKAVIVKEKR
jgi:predicted transcriptional regulator